MKKMGDYIFEIVLTLVVAGVIGTAFLTKRHRVDSASNQKKIQELTEAIDSNVVLIQSANEELAGVTDKTKDLVTDIGKAQTDLATLATQTKEITIENLGITKIMERFLKGSDEPIMIKFSPAINLVDLKLSTSFKDTVPVYLVSIDVKQFGLTSRERVRIYSEGEIDVLELDEYDDFSYFSFPHLLPNRRHNIGYLKNNAKKDWLRFEIEITTKTKRYLQKTFAYFVGCCWYFQHELYDENKVLIDKEKSVKISTDVIRKFEGDETVSATEGTQLYYNAPPYNEFENELKALDQLSNKEIYAKVDIVIQEIKNFESKSSDGYNDILEKRQKQLKEAYNSELSNFDKANKVDSIYRKSSSDNSKLSAKILQDYYKTTWSKATSLRDFLFSNITDYYDKRPKTYITDKTNTHILTPKDRERTNLLYNVSPTSTIIWDLRDLVNLHKKENE